MVSALGLVLSATVRLFRPSCFDLQLVAGSGLCSGETRGQHAKWRTGDVIHAHFVAELDRGRVAAVLSTNSDFKAGSSFAAAFDSDLHQFPDTFLINHREGVLLEDAFREIGRQHFVHVITRKAECSLGEVISAEAEELRFLGDLACDQRGSRQLDHGSDEVMDFFAFLAENFLRHAPHDGCLVLHFLHGCDERNHDLCVGLDSLLLYRNRRFEDGAGLHLGNFRVGDAQSAASMSEHGVELVQLFDPAKQSSQLFQFRRFRLRSLEHCDLDHQFFTLRQELVQRRIQQADGDWQAVHYA